MVYLETCLLVAVAVIASLSCANASLRSRDRAVRAMLAALIPGQIPYLKSFADIRQAHAAMFAAIMSRDVEAYDKAHTAFVAECLSAVDPDFVEARRCIEMTSLVPGAAETAGSCKDMFFLCTSLLYGSSSEEFEAAVFAFAVHDNPAVLAAVRPVRTSQTDLIAAAHV